MRCTFMSAAGNRFVVLDGFQDELPARLELLARQLMQAERASHLPWTPDGLLVLGKPRDAEADCFMEVYNRDGSRAEACGNGLRCMGVLARERGYALHELGAVRVATDAGLRVVHDARAVPLAPLPSSEGPGSSKGRAYEARASMGELVIVEPSVQLSAGGRDFDVMHVSAGNPHAVVVVEDEQAIDVAEIGAALGTHAHFPEGANVEFVAWHPGDPGRASARVWERGVGETRACGSGACAVALAVTSRLGVAHPIEVVMPGGSLVVDVDSSGTTWLRGPVVLESSGDLSGFAALAASPA
jgi:diaminopimelate epimerase